MGVTNREIIEDLGFVVENQTNLNIDNVKLLTRKKNVKTKYTFYKLFTNRLAILLFSILMIFFAFNIYPEFTFIDDRNDLMIDPIINTESFKKYYEEEIHDNSVILNADTKTFTDIESGNEYEINRNILEGYVWDYVSGNIPLMIFIIILPVLITSIITKKFALVRIFILSMLSIYYCLLINTIIICDDIEITYHIRWYVEHNKKGAIIFFIILYLISVIALIIQRAKYSKDATVVKEYKKMNSKDTIATKYLNILKKYNVLLSKDTEFNRAETNANLVTQMDKMYNYPLPNFTQNDIDIRTYINTSGIRSIIDKQSHEVITYLNDISNPNLKMPNNIHEKYLNVIKEIVSYMGDFDIGIANITELMNPSLPYKTNMLTSDNNWIYKQMAVPNLCNAFKKYSGIIQKINKDYSDYKKAWKEFNNDYKITEIGESGERSILKELKFFSSDMIILQNIRLEVHDESVETDAILCSPYGIFAIETKNLGSLGSYNIVIDKDGRWRKVMKNGKWKVMGSVSKQNTRHLHGIETVINQELGGSPFIQAHSIIAFANDVVGIKNYSNNTIVRGSEIMSVVRSHERCLTQDQIKKIAEILKNHSLQPKKYPVTNWMKEIVCRNIRIRESYREMRESLKPLIDIRNMYLSPFSNQPIDYDVFDLSLEDDESEYETPEEPTNHNNNNTPHSSGGGSSFSSYNSSNSYSNSDDDEFDRAVGNCEMGNSYSYSWYDEDYNKPTWEK